MEDLKKDPDLVKKFNKFIEKINELVPKKLKKMLSNMIQKALGSLDKTKDFKSAPNIVSFMKPRVR